VYLEGYKELDMVDEWSFAVDVDESEGVQMQGLAHDGMVIGPMVTDHHRTWGSEDIMKADLS
jgi:hypothetical protein